MVLIVIIFITGEYTERCFISWPNNFKYCDASRQRRRRNAARVPQPYAQLNFINRMHIGPVCIARSFFSDPAQSTRSLARAARSGLAPAAPHTTLTTTRNYPLLFKLTRVCAWPLVSVWGSREAAQRAGRRATGDHTWHRPKCYTTYDF